MFGQTGASGISSYGGQEGSGVFDFSQPSGWAMLAWILSILFLISIYFAL